MNTLHSSLFTPPLTLCGYTATEHVESAERWEKLARVNEHLPCAKFFKRKAWLRRQFAMCARALAMI